MFMDQDRYDTPSKENLDYVTEMAKAKLAQLGKRVPSKKKFGISYLDDHYNSRYDA